MITNATILRIAFSFMIILAILSYGPGPAYSQQADPSIQNLIINGGFEGGFQDDIGIGYGWGGFSNGNATVGWGVDDWKAVIVSGQYAQRLEISDAIEPDRYAGIYQTISVIPGEQYKLTIKGLIRSSEGDISISDYGYRLQYAVDYKGGVAWELVDGAEWKELPWDEQPMSEPTNGAYRQDSFETTITASSDRLTIFIRGWKKWLNKGSGIFDLDEISFVGPAPAGFQAPVAQEISVGNTEPEVQADQFAVSAPDAPQAEPEAEAVVEESPQMEDTSVSEAPAESSESTRIEVAPRAETRFGSDSSTAPSPETAPLPVSGRGDDDSINYVAIVGGALLLILFIAATLAATRRRSFVD